MGLGRVRKAKAPRAGDRASQRRAPLLAAAVASHDGAAIEWRRSPAPDAYLTSVNVACCGRDVPAELIATTVSR
jgi:hypothetical protein